MTARVTLPDPITVQVTADTRVLVVTAGVPVEGSGGVTAHGDLTGRDSADGHPIAAVTGLQTALDAKATTAALASHTGNTSNPHGVTAAQAGADPAGTAASAVATHAALTEVHGISAFGKTLVDDADAAAARTTLGALGEPLTTPRFTGQTSAPSAASAGEAKFYLHQLGKAMLAAYRGELGDPQYLFPSPANPFFRGQIATGASGWADIGGTFGSFAGSTGSAAVLPTVFGFSRTTAASTNSAPSTYGPIGLRDGSAVGDGFLYCALVRLPDASYGSGSTGVSISIGPALGGGVALPASNGRPGDRVCVLQYNTHQGDTTWKAIVNNGSNTITDTGLTVTPEKTYLVLILLPRGGAATYFYVGNVTDGTSASATVAATPGSTSLREHVQIVTLDNVARSIAIRHQWSVVGGVL